MVLTYMQRKVHSRKKSNDEHTKVNGRMIDIIFITRNKIANFSISVAVT